MWMLATLFANEDLRSARLWRRIRSRRSAVTRAAPWQFDGALHVREHGNYLGTIPRDRFTFPNEAHVSVGAPQ
jgi:hypothetical protein